MDRVSATFFIVLATVFTCRRPQNHKTGTHAASVTCLTYFNNVVGQIILALFVPQNLMNSSISPVCPLEFCAPQKSPFCKSSWPVNYWGSGVKICLIFQNGIAELDMKRDLFFLLGWKRLRERIWQAPKVSSSSWSRFWRSILQCTFKEILLYAVFISHLKVFYSYTRL